MSSLYQKKNDISFLTLEEIRDFEGTSYVSHVKCIDIIVQKFEN